MSKLEIFVLGLRISMFEILGLRISNFEILGILPISRNFAKFQIFTKSPNFHKKILVISQILWVLGYRYRRRGRRNHWQKVSLSPLVTVDAGQWGHLLRKLIILNINLVIKNFGEFGGFWFFVKFRIGRKLKIWNLGLTASKFRWSSSNFGKIRR